MKKIAILIAGLLLSASAFAQQGYFNSATPGWSAGNTATFTVCLPATATATCLATPDVVITSDVGGSSTITQPVTVPYSGNFPFYAPPGLYQICTAQTAPGRASTRCRLVTVPNDVAGNVALADGYYFQNAGAGCKFAQSGTGAGANGTNAIQGSVLALTAQTTDGGTDTLTCVISLPTRTTSGKGIVITSLQVNYGITLHAATSIGTATLQSYTAPAPGATETPSSATLVAAFGGTLTQSSSTGNLATVTAGQFYTNGITLGTPAQVADRQVLVLSWTIADSNSETFLAYVSGIGVHYKIAQ